ncbi:Asp23/Gls24 family envelope stress response protein [Bacillus sp. FJAT-45066]|uniref:Asp23/Gls24 family envelope stress response protein n=1 Tax=Bacillus sp. FJAT-45066 TaxID=2011010 RepID=UPI000BB85DC9|nr:Asp23/Gls24 family envelope stress response protein [Bacillus sp. FJAT-45066]
MRNKQIGQVDTIILDTITSVRLSEIDGIEEMKKSGLQKLLDILIRKCNDNQKYEKHQNVISISICVEVMFGENIIEKCYYLQRFLKEDVESLTGFKVESINVYIRKVLYKKEKNA